MPDMSANEDDALPLSSLLQTYKWLEEAEAKEKERRRMEGSAAS